MFNPKILRSCGLTYPAWIDWRTACGHFHTLAWPFCGAMPPRGLEMLAESQDELGSWLPRGGLWQGKPSRIGGGKLSCSIAPVNVLQPAFVRCAENTFAAPYLVTALVPKCGHKRPKAFPGTRGCKICSLTGWKKSLFVQKLMMLMCQENLWQC